ncbi:MAG: penicillin-binding transpeptidase domain-containing protein [Bdellovibrionota bacterium]
MGNVAWKWFQDSTPEREARQQFKEEYAFKEEFRKQWGSNIQAMSFPTEAQLDYRGSNKDVRIQYTLDSNLQMKAEKLLKSYKPDYGAIFVMDAESGRVLAMASFEKEPDFNSNLSLMSVYPAASIFKVVTATAVVDHAGVSPAHIIKFNGGNYTLFKKNVMSDRINRWTRRITLRDAFARSINTAFGRIALEELEPRDLSEYADRYFFNREIQTDFPVEMSLATIPSEKSFELTQVASGYNRFNRLSPVHGAMIASAVINDGVMTTPYIYQKIEERDSGNVIFESKVVDQHRVMSDRSSIKVAEMMGATIKSGTSRRSFRPLTRDRKFRELEMGGKTGHFTGENPKGKVDWFVGFASNDDQKIALAAVTVSKKYWTVKSAHLGQTLFREYFKQPVLDRKLSSVSKKN